MSLLFNTLSSLVGQKGREQCSKHFLAFWLILRDEQLVILHILDDVSFLIAPLFSLFLLLGGILRKAREPRGRGANYQGHDLLKL